MVIFGERKILPRESSLFTLYYHRTIETVPAFKTKTQFIHPNTIAASLLLTPLTKLTNHAPSTLFALFKIFVCSAERISTWWERPHVEYFFAPSSARTMAILCTAGVRCGRCNEPICHYARADVKMRKSRESAHVSILHSADSIVTDAGSAVGRDGWRYYNFDKYFARPC